MSTCEQIQRKSGASSTRAVSTSHRPRPSRSLAPASAPLAEQVTPDEYMQPAPGTRLRYSLAHIPVFPPEEAAPGNARADRHASPAEEAREQSALARADTHTTSSHRAASSPMAPQPKASMPGSPVIQRTHTKRKQTTASKSKISKKTKQEQEPTAVTEAPVEQSPQPLQVGNHPLNETVPQLQSLPVPQIGPDTPIAPSQGPQFTTALTTQGAQPYQSMELEAQPMEIVTIPQPQNSPTVAEQSANPVPTVKPLSDALRKELEIASKTGDSGDRQKALEKLSKDIQGQKIVKLTLESSDPKNPPIQLKIRYSTAKGARDKLALTKYKASGTDKKRKKQAVAKITITVYSGLFTQPPEAIYRRITQTQRKLATRMESC